MPIFDTLVLGADKFSVVFEFGHAFSKCGFAHEYSPRVFLKSQVYSKNAGKNVSLFEIKDEQFLYESLKSFIEKLYFGYLAINPKDRKVIVCESVFTTLLFKKVMLRLFYEHFNVPALLIVPSHLMALKTLQISTALVLDVGHIEAVCVPVVNGVSLLQQSNYAPLAGKAIDERILINLMESKAEIKVESEFRTFEQTDLIVDTLLEDIKCKLCLVSPYDRAREAQQKDYAEIQPQLADVRLPVGGDRVLTVPGAVIEKSCEVLFEEQADELNLPKLILETLLQCPLDSRRLLMNNIVLIGGTCQLPGIQHRMLQELIRLQQSNERYRSRIAMCEFKLHKMLCKESYAGWLGASIVGATDFVNARAITRDSYEKKKTNLLNDWSLWWPDTK